jgi:hypothetical protein
MDINKIFNKGNIIISNYNPFVFNRKTNKIVLNDDDDKSNTEIITADIHGFKNIEDIVLLLSRHKLIIVIKDSLRPASIPEFDFFLRYKIIK